MNDILKIIHIYSLMLGATAGIGNAILLSRLIARQGPPPEMVPEFMATLGKIGRWAITLLWLSGLVLALVEYGTLAMGWVFYLKLVAATVVLLAVMYLGVIAKRAREAVTPPDLKAMKKLSNLAGAAVFVAVVTAVVTFN